MAHPSVEAVVRAFLASVDRSRPGLVEGLYLTGSLALGDFRPGRSDVDFVAVTAQRLSATDVTALEQAHAVPARGPVPGGFEVGVDRAALHDWILGNLDGYWRRWHTTHRAPLSLASLAALGGWATAWGVLGVSRLHHTAATGEIVSKSAAGRYALETFAPEWHPVIEEALRLHGSVTAPPAAPSRPLRNPFARRRAATDFVAMVVEDATSAG
ncbi:nucleotidyltransferase domain-containing protein [Streptomyces chrestomyceticus]|uniref:nucleotidyltransferase domain-containing protein n=1 Tax=Streptomyces chrestomyceticus TaxID=68185 RepID=UPI001C3F9822|nr:nucleotidyltransferase domain-containing protein [Streptomyces chrestomyceticus]